MREFVVVRRTFFQLSVSVVTAARPWSVKTGDWRVECKQNEEIHRNRRILTLKTLKASLIHRQRHHILIANVSKNFDFGFINEFIANEIVEVVLSARYKITFLIRFNEYGVFFSWCPRFFT